MKTTRNKATVWEVRKCPWWRHNASWPGGREPYAQPWNEAVLLGRFDTREEARAYAQEYNASHDPGPLSVKAEFDERQL